MRPSQGDDDGFEPDAESSERVGGGGGVVGSARVGNDASGGGIALAGLASSQGAFESVGGLDVVLQKLGR